MKPLSFSLTFGCGLWLTCGASAPAQPYTITTIAGQPGLRSVDGTNNGALFLLPFGMARDSAGNLYVSDYAACVIRKMTLVGTNWVVTTIAGQAGANGHTDGMNNTALFMQPTGITVDSAGNLYVADSGNNAIRKITPVGTNWVVTTYAGSFGSGGGGLGQDGPGYIASFWNPEGITVDKADNLYVADTLDQTIRMITPGSPYGYVNTIAGLAPERGGGSGSTDGTNIARFNSPTSIALDSGTNLYVTDTGNNTVRKLRPLPPNPVVYYAVTTIAGLAGTNGSADGTNSNARFNSPQGIAVDRGTNLYVPDGNNYTLRRVSPQGTNWVVSTIAGSAGVPGSGDGTNSSAQFKTSIGIVLDSATNLYVADFRDGTIREVTPVGTNYVVSTFAGQAGIRSTDGTNTSAHYCVPAGIAVDRFGNVFVADGLNETIRMLGRAGTNWVSSTLAGMAGVPGSVDGTNAAARFYSPYGVAVDSEDNLYVADEYDFTIREISPVGTNWVVTTIAGTARVPGFANGTNGNAQFQTPEGLAVDSATNIYVVDLGNNALRKVTPVGSNWVVSTLAGGNFGSADGTNNQAQFGFPEGVAVDGLGNLYVADSDNNTIRKITPIGTNWVVTTIAGKAGSYGNTDGIGGNARFDFPTGVAVDSVGDLFVTDDGNAVLRKITPVGTNWVVTTVAGLAGAISNLDGTGSTAQFVSPYAIAVDGSDNLYVADWGADTIRFGQAAAWLQTSFSANQLVLSWPLAASNYVLQTSSALSSNAAWAPVTHGVTLSGLSFVVTNTPIAPAAFFRLQHQ